MVKQLEGVRIVAVSAHDHVLALSDQGEGTSNVAFAILTQALFQSGHGARIPAVKWVTIAIVQWHTPPASSR